MKTARFIVEFLSFLSGLILGCIFVLTLKDRYWPLWSHLVLAGSSLWFFASSLYLQICGNFGNSPLSRTGKTTLGFNGAMILFLVVVGVLPHFVKPRATSCGNACINNLRQMDAAANQFALEKGLT
jgi:hypothetical protein